MGGKLREFQRELTDIYNPNCEAFLNPFSENFASIDELPIEQLPQDNTNLLTQQELLKLCEEQLIKLFFYGNSTYPNFKYFLKIIKNNDLNFAITLSKCLKKINPKRLFPFFHNNSCSGFIELFKENPCENLALELLKLLDQFEGEELSILIQDSHRGLFDFLQDQNLLHLVCKFQSSKVIEELFRILRKLEIKTIKILLSQRDGPCDLTPVEYAFARQNETDIGIVVAKILQANEDLKTLFTDFSSFQPLSLMHKAVAKGQIAVIAYYLEQEEAQLEQLSASAESMLELAQQAKQEEIIACFAALPFLKLIKATDKPLANIQELTEAIRANPAILSTLWTEGKTLLHLASAEGQAPLVKLFLQAGASLRIKDAYNLSPIDIAVKTNQLDSFKELINFLETQDEELALSLVETLHKIESPLQNYSALQNTLKQQEAISLETYCQQYHDCYIYFLKTIGKVLSLQDDQALLEAVKTYIHKNLQKISASKNQKEHKAWQLQLIILIFSIPTKKGLEILSRLQLTELENTELGLTLVEALVQPLIYNSLPVLEQLDHYQFLKQLSPESNLILTLANNLFSNSNLTQMPADILLELAKNTSTDSLLSFCELRIDPILTVLTLEKLLKTSSSKRDKLESLFKQLENEIRPYKKQVSLVENQAFIFLLNLITEPELKSFMRNIIAELNQDKPLPQELRQFFKSLNESSPLRADSLLADLFKDYICSGALLDQTDYQGLASLFAIARPETLSEILENLRPYSLSPPSTNQFLELTNWLQRLENKTQRLSLSTLITQLDQLYNQAGELAKPITNAEHYLLYTALKNYAKILNELATLTFSIHLDQTEKAYNEKLKTTLEQLILAFNSVLGQVDNLSLNTYPNLTVELNELKAEDTIYILCDTIKNTCINIDHNYSTKTSETIQP